MGQTMGRIAGILGKRQIFWPRSLALALILALMSGLNHSAVTFAAAATQQCPTLPLSVTTDDAALSERICDAAQRAAKLSAECGISQSEPVQIQVLDGLNSDYPKCAGIFHCAEAKIDLVAPDSLAKVLGTDHPFLEIPRDILYDSLVVHEMTHALTYQTRNGPLDGTAETEYIAYAIQMWFLPEDVRTSFLSRHPITEPVTLAALNDVILGFSPAVFAVRAWKHFEAPENGCQFIQRLLDGENLLSINGAP